MSDNDNDNYKTSINNWEELDTKVELLRGIYSNGFEKPSPIQARAIKPLFDGKDIIAQAQSGTGKTGCFVIGCLERIDMNLDGTQIMILSPTRELSVQTKEVVDKIGVHFKNLKTELLIGGVSVDENIMNLKRNPKIVIGCPGRTYDMLSRNKLLVNNLKILILDEADEILSSGFKEQIYNIFKYLPNDVQVGLFSATMSNELYEVAEKFMRTPVNIKVKTEQLTLEGIKQYYIGLDDDNQKCDTIKDLYSMLSLSQCIIYCNSVSRVNLLYDELSKDNFPVCCIHGNMDRNERMENYKEFKSGKYRVLISSNVTARGIDIQQVNIVINFDIPKCVHTYLHRIGRSGRWGRKGVGINLVTRRDLKNMKDIETYYSTEIKELPASWNGE